MRVSVCMASFNGAAHVQEQLRSILCSPLVDEVIVSDDGSTDGTVQIIKDIGDDRVMLVDGPRAGLIRNFEHALTKASGDVIFLSDQDDVWLPGKVERVLPLLMDADLVITDCRVVDGALRELHPSFFRLNHSAPGVLRNFIKNGYLGCCMAMQKWVVQVGVPFPPGVPMHDWWLGLVAEWNGTAYFHNEPLSLYRRHGQNASSTTERSQFSLYRRLMWRSQLAYSLVLGPGSRKRVSQVRKNAA